MDKSRADPFYLEFIKLVRLQMELKNYGIVETEEMKKKIERSLKGICIRELPKGFDKYLEEIGVELNFYTNISTRMGLWSSDFSNRLLDAKLKKHTTH